jgi:hypothetical protein
MLACLFLVVFISTAASSPLSQNTDRSSVSNSGTQYSNMNGDQKINQILSLITPDLILEYLTTLVGYGPRMDGTYGCEIAGRYIHDQLTTMGLQTRYQNWSHWGSYYYHHFYTGQNIEGTLAGSDPADDSTLIFNAHYDSVAASPGANDDGSGTVAVLAAAYALSHFTFQRTIKFVAFSGEEIRLLGSQAYAKEAYDRNDQILLEINADMIGRDIGSNSLRITTTEDAGWAADAFQMIDQNYSIGLTLKRGNITRENHKLSGSDYAPFLYYGWESLCCWQVDPDPNFHTERDNLSNVNLSYLVNTTRIIAGALAYLADLPEVPPQVRIVSPRIGFLYSAGMEKRAIQEYKTIVFDDIWVWADIEPVTTPIQRVEFYYDGKLMFMDVEAPFKWHFNKFSLGKHEITVIAYDTEGRSSTDWRSIRFINILKNNH